MRQIWSNLVKYRLEIGILWCGLICSVVLHELVHLILHIGEISHVHLLPNLYTGVELTLSGTGDDDLVAEEFLAYLMSAIMLVLTYFAINRNLDKNSTKSSIEILNLQASSDALDADPSLLFTLAERADLLPSLK